MNFRIFILISFCISGVITAPAKLKRLHFVPVRNLAEHDPSVPEIDDELSQTNSTVMTPRPPMVLVPRPQINRFLWSYLGDFIESSPYFPIEVNFPDTVSNIYSGVSGLAGSIAQRIPIINRWTNPNQPRPLQYYILVPIQNPPNTLNYAYHQPENTVLMVPTRKNLKTPHKTKYFDSIKEFFENFRPTPTGAQNDEKPVPPASIEVPFMTTPNQETSQDNLLRYLFYLQEHNYMLQQGQMMLQPNGRPEVPFQAPIMPIPPSYYYNNALTRRGGGYGLYYSIQVPENERGVPNLSYNMDGTIAERQ